MDREEIIRRFKASIDEKLNHLEQFNPDRLALAYAGMQIAGIVEAAKLLDITENDLGIVFDGKRYNRL